MLTELNNRVSDTLAAGRVCPLHYQLAPEQFRTSRASADVLYVAGGLYGNPFALTAIEAMLAAEESDNALLVLNGDYHWFDTAPQWFDEIHRRSARHLLTRGNVETEMCQGGDTDVGCGCAYPDSVADADVARSNNIMKELGQTARQVLTDEQLADIRSLPTAATITVGSARVGITHGDDQSLAGWSFAQDRLAGAWNDGLAERMRAYDLDVFASSHTCLPVADCVSTDAGQRAVINNGSAGMANFAGQSFGLVSRIAAADCGPAPVAALYETRLAGVTVSAIPVHFELDDWLSLFTTQWPPHSAASTSYLARMMEGPVFHVNEAVRGGFVRYRPGDSVNLGKAA